MRKIIKDFISFAATTIPILDPIYEFGSLQVPGQEGFADLRPLFPGKQYFGCDMREGPGVDKVLNLHDTHLPEKSVGTVLCLDTLEHVEYPHRALEEIHRILKPRGIAIISSVMNFPIHDYPYDYWRFTPEAFRSILKPFCDSFIGFAGDENFPHTVVGIGFKGDKPLLSEFNRMYEIWQKRQPRSIASIMRLVTPPLLIPVASRLGHALCVLTRRST
jgi:SAM-dependent methyltransferase